MLKKIPFHGKTTNIHKLATIYKISAKEITFRYEHGCREDNLVVKHVYDESPYSFIKFNNKKITIKEFLIMYPNFNVFIIRNRFNAGKSLIAPLTKYETNQYRHLYK